MSRVDQGLYLRCIDDADLGPMIAKQMLTRCIFCLKGEACILEVFWIDLDQALRPSFVGNTGRGRLCERSSSCSSQMKLSKEVQTKNARYRPQKELASKVLA